ncbi:MAG: hypothetical protein ABIG29_03530 [Candidatus Nealsonbacteria bacterium]
MQEFTSSTQLLVDRYQEWSRSLQAKEGVSTINVDEVASRVASFYEKMRGVIDWREEHLLRKTAIERILKRRLFLKKNLDMAEKIAEPFIYELIRGGHFPNETIPESKIDEVQKIIDKCVFILENSPTPEKEKAKMYLYDWLFGVAACEIEATLSPSPKENALIDFMMEAMKAGIRVKERSSVRSISEGEADTQLYIAVQRALFKLDSPTITYNLLRRWFPDWANLPRPALNEITSNIYLIWKKIEEALKHPLSEKFYAICERYDTPYLILGDIISQNPAQAQQILKNPGVLESKIKEAYGFRLKKVGLKMNRAAIYSTISIFLTKVLVALAIEVPFDKYVTQQFNYLTSVLSIMAPPVLMFFLVLSIRPPSKHNEDMVIMEVMKIVYGKEKRDIYEIRPSLRRGLVLNLFMVVFYLAGFIASYGFIVWGLQKMNFSILSIIIFLLFVSMISFAGVKIRQRAKELVVEKEKETFLHGLLDLFSLPIIQVGRWLSNQWAKYNAVAIIFNSLLDMPFQLFVEFLEQWRSFLREKKEKIH